MRLEARRSREGADDPCVFSGVNGFIEGGGEGVRVVLNAENPATPFHKF